MQLSTMKTKPSVVKPVVLHVVNRLPRGGFVCSVPSCRAWFHLGESALTGLHARFGSALRVVWEEHVESSEALLWDGSECKSSEVADVSAYFKSSSLGLRALNDESIFENPVVSVSSRCNLRCPYCYMSMPSLDKHQRKDVGVLKIKQFISNVIELGANTTRTIQFFGGEPLLHKNLPELIAFALDRGLYVRISTNGTASRLRAESFRPYASDKRVEWRVSLDSHIREKHELYRGRGTFKATQRNLEYLASMNANVSIKTVLSRENIEDFPGYLQFAYERGFRVAYGVLGTVGDAKRHGLYSGISKLEVVKRILGLFRQEPGLVGLLRPSPFGRMIRALYVKNTSALPPFFFYMHHNETVYPMDELVHGQFQVGSWDKLDVDQMRLMHKKYCLENSACTNCAIEPFCYRGSYADTFEAGKSLDQEFTTCNERRNIYGLLMSLGFEGASIARAMFGN